MRRPRRKAEETREDILNTAEALFREKGYSGVSIADIAAALEMSPANVFKHFQSKLVLGQAIAHRYGEKFRARCDEVQQDAGLPADIRLTRFVDRLTKDHLQKMQNDRYLFEMLPFVFEDPENKGRMYRGLVRDRIADILADGMDAQLFRKGDPVRDAEVIVDMLTCVLHPNMVKCADMATQSDKAHAILRLVDAGLKYGVAK
ncbi:TetR/AcrR family transcriptional regulator [Martelella alba]|uniref:TetR/AcrR family transcriptional regulator n=1 Tax=Martelella alba TaxID=2590451 RepID=A0A506U2N0_9HYPH|nr:TetR/AcrR family transcriptional regulator [Martelella alba]TPW27531.1 TetR/AcrR family transcriptional regulator [Martelella alba]